MKDDIIRVLIAGCALALAASTGLASCSGPGWGRTADVGLDVAECTIDRLIEEARRGGNTELAAQLRQVKMREIPAGASSK